AGEHYGGEVMGPRAGLLVRVQLEAWELASGAYRHALTQRGGCKLVEPVLAPERLLLSGVSRDLVIAIVELLARELPAERRTQDLLEPILDLLGGPLPSAIIELRLGVAHAALVLEHRHRAVLFRVIGTEHLVGGPAAVRGQGQGELGVVGIHRV